MTDNDKSQIESTIERLAEGGLRTICLAYRDLPSSFDWDSVDDNGYPLVESDKLVLIGLVGIVDPVRPGVPLSV